MEPIETTKMAPETEIRYLREQNKHLEGQLEASQAINNDMGKRISDYIATIRVLVELSAHHWL